MVNNTCRNIGISLLISLSASANSQSNIFAHADNTPELVFSYKNYQPLITLTNCDGFFGRQPTRIGNYGEIRLNPCEPFRLRFLLGPNVEPGKMSISITKNSISQRDDATRTFAPEKTVTAGEDGRTENGEFKVKINDAQIDGSAYQGRVLVIGQEVIQIKRVEKATQSLVLVSTPAQKLKKDMIMKVADLGVESDNPGVRSTTTDIKLDELKSKNLMRDRTQKNSKAPPALPNGDVVVLEKISETEYVLTDTGTLRVLRDGSVTVKVSDGITELKAVLLPADKWDFATGFKPFFTITHGQSFQFSGVSSSIGHFGNSNLSIDAIGVFQQGGTNTNGTSLGAGLSWFLQFGSSYKTTGHSAYGFPLRVNFTTGFQKLDFLSNAKGSGVPFFGIGIQIPLG